MQNLTALVLTYNEKPNIGRTLSNLSSLPQVIVVDSFSADSTVHIAQTFPNVIVFERAFDEHTAQWEFARNKVNTEWTLALDADYQFSKAGIDEILSLVESNPKENGFFAQFFYAIEGNVIKSGIYPPVCVLYRTKNAHYVKDGHTQRIEVQGNTGFLKEKIIHDDRKDFAHWLQAQVNYAKLEAQKLCSESETKSKNDKIRLKTKFTPILVFFYCIFVNRGYKDGSSGWKYAFQRMMAELILQYFLLDFKR